MSSLCLCSFFSLLVHACAWPGFFSSFLPCQSPLLLFFFRFFRSSRHRQGKYASILPIMWFLISPPFILLFVVLCSINCLARFLLSFFVFNHVLFVKRIFALGVIFLWTVSKRKSLRPSECDSVLDGEMDCFYMFVWVFLVNGERNYLLDLAVHLKNVYFDCCVVSHCRDRLDSAKRW